jgi:hypothetical protein
MVSHPGSANIWQDRTLCPTHPPVQGQPSGVEGTERQPVNHPERRHLIREYRFTVTQSCLQTCFRTAGI